MTDADWRDGRTRDDLLNMLQSVQTRWDERRGWLFGAACLRRIWDLLTDARFRELVEAAEDRGCGLESPGDFGNVRNRLPRIGNWRPPAPSPLLWEPHPLYPVAGIGPATDVRIPPPGVLNFRELPFWVQQTHYATVALGNFYVREVVLSAAAARADHTAEQSAELKPFEDQIAAINRETDRFQREHDDAVWRGMSSAGRKGDALRERRELAGVQIRERRAEQLAVRERIADAARASEHAAQADLLRCVAGNPFAPVVFAAHWRTETVAQLVRGVVADRAFDRLPILADALEEAGCDYPDVLSHARTPGPHALGCWVLGGLTESS